MIRMIYLMVFAVLIAPIAQAQPPVSAFQLDNGMQVIVIEDHRAPVVTHMVWYRVGAADEPIGQSGIAHFLEHLMFKGTDTIPEGRFSPIISENGGEDNAFTSYDYTAYHQRIAADRLDMVMGMEADRMQNLVLTDENTLPERGVILEERNSRTDTNPGALLQEAMGAALYRNHPYGIPVIGWRHEMETLTRQDALDFYARYYAPDNAILVVAGDVSPAEVLTLAKQHYGPLTASGNPRAPRATEPPQRSARVVTFADAKVQQPYVTRIYSAPARRSGSQQEAAALKVLAELLGGSPTTSAFARHLNFETKLALSSGAYSQGLALDSAQFSVYAVPAPGVTLEALNAEIDVVIADFIANGPDPDALERIKTQVRAAEIYAQDNQAGLARSYGAALSLGLGIEDVQAWPEILQSVTAEEVQRAAQQVLRPENSVTGFLMTPKEGQE